MDRVPRPTYRQKEIEAIAKWLENSASGAVAGLAGAGKSNLLRFICRHPEAIRKHFHNQEQTIIPISIDLNDLPTYDLATFYRTILRSFYETKESFTLDLQKQITTFYQDNKQNSDPFVSLSTLRELLALLKTEEIRVVLVMDRFGYLTEVASPQMFNTLRGLRDSAKKNLCYLVGLRQELNNLPDLGKIDELHELLDGHTCWVGPMAEEDARHLINEEMAEAIEQPTTHEAKAMLTLSGRYPALLKAICRWWRVETDKPNIKLWSAALLDNEGVQNRLEEVWNDLTQEEQLVLSELEEERRKPSRKASHALEARHRPLLNRLAAKGLCYKQSGQWFLQGSLLSDFVAQVQERGRGRIWFDQETEQFWQGSTRLELPPQLHMALLYFFHHPRQRLPKSELLMEIWPDEWAEVDEARLYQLIRQLRQRIEPNPAYPVYIVSWRSSPEGGYQFFPEGRAREG